MNTIGVLLGLGLHENTNRHHIVSLNQRDADTLAGLLNQRDAGRLAVILKANGMSPTRTSALFDCPCHLLTAECWSG